MAGRPSALNDEMTLAIEAGLKSGAYIETAVIAAGVTKQTFYNWMSTGAKDHAAKRDTPHAAFFSRITKVLANVEIELCKKVQTETGPAWTRYAWMLERRFRDRWANTPRTAKEL